MGALKAINAPICGEEIDFSHSRGSSLQFSAPIVHPKLRFARDVTYHVR
jgi:hypothetical protein